MIQTSQPEHPTGVRRHPVQRMAFDLVLPVLAVGCLLAPAVGAIASNPVPVIRVAADRTPVIHVEAFEDLAVGSCIPDPRLHLGPMKVEGKLGNKGALITRITAAVSRCEGGWFGDVTVKVAIDGAGAIRDVGADASGDGQMRTCVIRNVLREGPVDARGPGVLTIGYFMGTRAI